MAIMYEIGGGVFEYEASGQAKTVDFNKKNGEERHDWAIRYVNTLNAIKGEPLETGEGQHDRKPKEKPLKEQVAPLSK